jgi:Ni,Fe-hydrogenase I cytochrome b subunit
MEESKVSRSQRKDYSIFALFIGNLSLIAWIILGAYAQSFIHPLLCWIYLILVAFGVYYVLRKNCCKTCYYCKGCTLGIGKLPELFFWKSGTENVTNEGLKTFPYYFIAMTVLPTALLSYSIIDKYAFEKMVVLIFIIIFSIWSGIARRKLLLKRSNV